MLKLFESISIAQLLNFHEKSHILTISLYMNLHHKGSFVLEIIRIIRNNGKLLSQLAHLEGSDKIRKS